MSSSIERKCEKTSWAGEAGVHACMYVLYILYTVQCRGPNPSKEETEGVKNIYL